MVFKSKDDQTPLMLDFMKGRKCLWNIKSEHYTNITAGENSLQEVVHWLNFPELTVEDVKLKIRIIRIKCAAELAKVIQSEKKSRWPTLHFCAENVVVQTSTFIPAWRMYCTNLGDNKGCFFPPNNFPQRVAAILK
jgi:hypothetical protein